MWRAEPAPGAPSLRSCGALSRCLCSVCGEFWHAPAADTFAASAPTVIPWRSRRRARMLLAIASSPWRRYAWRRESTSGRRISIGMHCSGYPAYIVAMHTGTPAYAGPLQQFLRDSCMAARRLLVSHIRHCGAAFGSSWAVILRLLARGPLPLRAPRDDGAARSLGQTRGKRGGVSICRWRVQRLPPARCWP